MTLTMVRPLNGKIMTRHINNFFYLCRIEFHPIVSTKPTAYRIEKD